MRLLPLILLLLPFTLGAQDLYATRFQARPAKQIICLTTVPGGNDMNRQQVVQCNEKGEPVRVTIKGFGGEQTSDLNGGNAQEDYGIDADGDTVSLTRTTATQCLTTHYAYRRPHQRLAAKTYCVALATHTLLYYQMDEYNKRGQVVRSMKYTPDDVPQTQWRYKYDSMGNVVSSTEIRYDDAGHKEGTTLTTYRYTYDSEGNWTRKDYLLNGQLMYTHTREIIYW